MASLFPGVTLASVGSLNVDLIAFVDHLPAAGETLMGSAFAMGPGGKGANQCACAARLAGDAEGGGSCAMVGAVGDDLFGKDYVQAFRRSGVVTDLVAVLPGQSTGVAPISVDAKGENAIVVVPGANFALTPADVEAALARLPALRSVLVQLEVREATTLAALRAARARGIATFLTPAPAPPAGLDDAFFELASVIIPNAGEARQLVGAGAGAAAGGGSVLEAADAASAALLARGARFVCVTLGSAGVLLSARGGLRAHVPAVAVERVVDTTGAGDAFSGALAFFYAGLVGPRGAAAEIEWPLLVEAARRACFVAAVSVTRRGTQSSYPTRSELPAALFDFASQSAEIPAAVAAAAAR
jgi:ribokinase